MGRDAAGGGESPAGRSRPLGRAAGRSWRCWRRSRRGGSGCWARPARRAGRGRPTIAMDTYVRLMIVKHRSGWGYETLMREVSDSLHLRRFCRIGMTDRVPDESTVRKLTRRLGAEVVHEITRELIQKARREKRFRPRAARIDSTVIEADVQLSDRRGAGGRWCPGACPGGAQARGEDRREAHRGARSLAVDGPQAQGVDALDPPTLGRGEDRGAGADRADRQAARALGPRGAQARRDRPASRAWARRACEAEGRPGSCSNSPIAARRSPSRSTSASLGSRSRIG